MRVFGPNAVYVFHFRIALVIGKLKAHLGYQHYTDGKPYPQRQNLHQHISSFHCILFFKRYSFQRLFFSATDIIQLLFLEYPGRIETGNP